MLVEDFLAPSSVVVLTIYLAVFLYIKTTCIPTGFTILHLGDIVNTDISPVQERKGGVEKSGNKHSSETIAA
jgi:hypothetical protein